MSEVFWVLVVVSAIIVGAWIIAVNSPDDDVTLLVPESKPTPKQPEPEDNLNENPYRPEVLDED